MVIMASEEQLEIVKKITQETITAIYPRYYPNGAVDFFRKHHNDEHIRADINDGTVYLLMDNDKYIGTVTIKENEICRLFVLPDFQHKGYGKMLLEFAENKISEEYSAVILAASLPAKKIYRLRNYFEIENHQIVSDNGDILCYDLMKKELTKSMTAINYNGKSFVPRSNTENGEVSGETIFNYHQNGFDFYADYCGGDVKKGYMIGKVSLNGEIDFYYQHINTNEEIRAGKCHSIPVVNDDGKIELHEEWQWLNGDCSSGKSIVVER